jgi:putative membrane protein
LACLHSKIDADDFVEEVSAQGIAEVESAKMAKKLAVKHDKK